MSQNNDQDMGPLMGLVVGVVGVVAAFSLLKKILNFVQNLIFKILTALINAAVTHVPHLIAIGLAGWGIWYLHKEIKFALRRSKMFRESVINERNLFEKRVDQMFKSAEISTHYRLLAVEKKLARLTKEPTAAAVAVVPTLAERADAAVTAEAPASKTLEKKSEVLEADFNSSAAVNPF